MLATADHCRIRPKPTLPPGSSARVLFLDRDGVINSPMLPHQYVLSWEQFSFTSGIMDVLARASTLGYLLIIVTNQQGVGTGVLPEAALRQIHERMLATLRSHGVEVAGVYYCPHRQEDDCACRKPRTGMLQRAEVDLGVPIDRHLSFIVGDSSADIVAGLQFGVKGIYVAPEGPPMPELPAGTVYNVRAVQEIPGILEKEIRSRMSTASQTDGTALAAG